MNKTTNRLAVVVILFLIAASCHNAIDRQLDEIEWKISDNPRSAYEQLSEIPANDLNSKSRQARYALLKSLAMDKSYIDVADDSLIQVAVRYYKNGRADRNRMLALYSLGRVQLNAENRTGAIISLLQAKEIAERLDDRHYFGLITKNMASIYGESQDFETELSLYQESAEAFDSIEEPLYAAYSRLGEAVACLSLGKMDVADSILVCLETYAREGQRIELLCFVLRDQAMIQAMPNMKNPEKVVSLYREMATLGYPASVTSDFGTIALAFEHMGQVDSADYYLSLAENTENTLASSVHICNAKFGILSHRKDFELANEQMKKGIEIHNKIVSSQENHLIANAIRDYREQESLHHASLSRYRLILLFLMIVVAVALLCILVQQVLLHRRQVKEKERVLREKEERIEEDLLQISEITDNLQTARRDCTDLALAVNIALQEKISVVKMFADAYSVIQEEPRVKPSDPYRYLDEDPKKKKAEQLESFLQALESFRHDGSLFLLLEDSVNKFRDNLMARFRESCRMVGSGRPLFNESDYRIIMLLFAGVPDKTIAFLVNMTCGAVRTRKTRYKERIAQFMPEDGELYLQALSFQSPNSGV